MILNIFKKYFQKEPQLKVLLDIDGVLSPLGALKEPYEEIAIEWATFQIPLKTLSFLSFLETKAEITWSSSWMDLSNLINDHRGVEHYDYLFFHDSSDDREQWMKESSIIEFIENNMADKILIIDDEIPNETLLKKFSHVKMIKPESIAGLTDKEFEEIIDWLSAQNIN